MQYKEEEKTAHNRPAAVITNLPLERHEKTFDQWRCYRGRSIKGSIEPSQATRSVGYEATKCLENAHAVLKAKYDKMIQGRLSISMSASQNQNQTKPKPKPA